MGRWERDRWRKAGGLGWSARGQWPVVMMGLVLLAPLISGCSEPSTTPPGGASAAATPRPSTPAADGPKNRRPTIDVENPQFCAGCHAAVVSEWQESMHAQADDSKDSIYAKMRELRRAKQGDAVAGRCVHCHGVRSVVTGRDAVNVHGVSCAACHNVARVDLSKGPGSGALAWAEDGVLLGPHDVKPGFSPVHGTGAAPTHMTDGSTLCLACHGAMKNGAGAPTCTTGPEWKGEAEKGAASCVSCHMPTVLGPAGAVSKRREHRSHQFLGPHRAWQHDDKAVLEQAVNLSASFKGQGVEVVLEATSGHAFPSGFPGRFAKLLVEAKNASGQVLATPDPVLFNKVYVNAEGEKVPAAFATELKRDSRLKPGERRVVMVDGIPAGASVVEVKLLYGLLPPPLADKLGLGADPLAKPKLLRSAILKR